MQHCIAFIAMSLALSASAANVQLRQAVLNKGFVKPIEFKHRLRVCNAYAFAGKLDVYRGKGEKLTTDGPLPYKGCKDFVSPLKSGDKLDFKIADSSAGSFSVAELPNNDAVLLLVVQRHDSVSTAVSFESHVFANLPNAQVAVIDTYKGTKKDMPRIMDAKTGKNGSRTEDLRYDSVVAVSPGLYEVTLADEKTARSPLVALDHESYVVLRIGNEDKRGHSFPEELVVFPQSDAHALPSAAVMTLAPTSTLFLAFIAFVASMM